MTSSRQMTLEEYESERKLAKELGFVMNDLQITSYSIVKDVCNGIGPAAMPQPFVDALNKLHPSLKPVADNHDLNFYKGDGTWADFTACNQAFYENGCKVAKWKYKAYDVRRYIVIFDAWNFSRACQNKIGWSAYTAAIKKRMEDEAAGYVPPDLALTMA